MSAIESSVSKVENTIVSTMEESTENTVENTIVSTVEESTENTVEESTENTTENAIASTTEESTENTIEESSVSTVDTTPIVWKNTIFGEEPIYSLAFDKEFKKWEEKLLAGVAYPLPPLEERDAFYKKKFLESGIDEETLNKFPLIHITGSKGKGSVAMKITHLLSTKYKVATFTSPHLIKYNERLRINGEPISLPRFLQLLQKVVTKCEDQSYLQILLSMFIHLCVEEKVDCAVVEVGMGGTYDCTNWLGNLKIAIITSVELEHQEYLGDTIQSIAQNKSGIIKEKCHVIVPDTLLTIAFNEIRRKQEETNSVLHLVEVPSWPHNEQIEKCNFLLAIKCAELLLGTSIKYEVLNKSNVQLINKYGKTMNVRFPHLFGRRDVFKNGNRKIYIDSAHTKNSIVYCAEWFISQITKECHYYKNGKMELDTDEDIDEPMDEIDEAADDTAETEKTVDDTDETIEEEPAYPFEDYTEEEMIEVFRDLIAVRKSVLYAKKHEKICRKKNCKCDIYSPLKFYTQKQMIKCYDTQLMAERANITDPFIDYTMSELNKVEKILRARIDQILEARKNKAGRSKSQMRKMNKAGCSKTQDEAGCSKTQDEAGCMDSRKRGHSQDSEIPSKRARLNEDDLLKSLRKMKNDDLLKKSLQKIKSNLKIPTYENFVNSHSSSDDEINESNINNFIEEIEYDTTDDLWRIETEKQILADIEREEKEEQDRIDEAERKIIEGMDLAFQEEESSMIETERKMLAEMELAFQEEEASRMEAERAMLADLELECQAQEDSMMEAQRKMLADLELECQEEKARIDDPLINFVATSEKNIPKKSERALIFNFTGPRNYATFLKILSSCNFDIVCFTKNNSGYSKPTCKESAIDGETMKKYWNKISPNSKVFVTDTVKNAFDIVSKSKYVLVTGSLYLAGCALEVVDKNKNYLICKC